MVVRFHEKKGGGNRVMGIMSKSFAGRPRHCHSMLYHHGIIPTKNHACSLACTFSKRVHLGFVGPHHMDLPLTVP